MNEAPRKGHKRTIGVLFGGRSGEHEVSLASARSVMEHIDSHKYDVVPIGITKQGTWIVGGDPMYALSAGIPAASRPATLLPDPARPGLWDLEPVAQGQLAALPAHDQAIVAVRLAELEVVFPVLHGTYGEDGTVQGLLELAGVPYVGCGVLASALAMDKAAANAVFRAHGLPVLPDIVVTRKAWRAAPVDVVAQVEAALTYPVFVKPANMGSSVGITKVHARDELPGALDLAARYDRKLLVQQGIQPREIEVSVLGNDAPIASVPGEVVPSREFYDYRAKYIDDDSELLIPAPLDAALTERVREMAIAAYKALDCAGMARADFLLDKVSGELWINELNTIPGFTQISMYPKLWAATGISYGELIDRLIELAIERHEDRNQSLTSYAVEDDG
ncbi:MAG: D-alanine--D-alanine ligase [Anaerolineae bacterium]|nr:D-alanine--D-alanine ligase [Anaerolineae bacterium]